MLSGPCCLAGSEITHVSELPFLIGLEPEGGAEGLGILSTKVPPSKTCEKDLCLFTHSKYHVLIIIHFIEVPYPHGLLEARKMVNWSHFCLFHIYITFIRQAIGFHMRVSKVQNLSTN